MRTPFVYYGSKRTVAAAVWQRFGDPAAYYEPFAGSAAVLLGRPTPGKFEAICDADGLVTNFWRAVKAVPPVVASHADHPPSTIDLKAKDKAIKERLPNLVQELKDDPGFHDPEIAGWWAWVMSTQIGTHAAAMSMATRGVHRERSKDTLFSYMDELGRRLSKVHIHFGDWTTLVNDARVKGGSTAVFLDPPYTAKTKRSPGLYKTDSLTVGDYVQRWALAAAKSVPKLRIALCGYQGEYSMPGDWEEFSWKSHDGKGRERIWFSPGCTKADGGSGE